MKHLHTRLVNLHILFQMMRTLRSAGMILDNCVILKMIKFVLKRFKILQDFINVGNSLGLAYLPVIILSYNIILPDFSGPIILFGDCPYRIVMDVAAC